MLRRLLSSLLAALLVATGLVAAETRLAPPAQATFATSDSLGKYARSIYWLDWSKGFKADGTPLATETNPKWSGNIGKAIVNGAYVDVTPIEGYTVRATVRNIVGTAPSGLSITRSLRLT